MLLTDASHPTPHPSRVARHLVSLRLGHARALTPHCGVIHSPRAAMLPQGEGFELACHQQKGATHRSPLQELCLSCLLDKLELLKETLSA